MRLPIIVLLGLVLLASVLSGGGAVDASRTHGQVNTSVSGAWQGVFVRGPIHLRVIVHLTAGADGKFSATLDSPDQGASGIQLEAVTYSGGVLHFEFAAAKISFTGTLSQDGAEFNGVWTQGVPSPFVLSRQDATLPAVPPLKRGSLVLTPCGIPSLTRQARCGKYEVFEDRTARAGRKIALNLLVLPATEALSLKDAVFFIAGGPGQGSVDVIKQGDFLAPLHRNRDLVFVDQRGTGESNPLTCPLTGDPNALATYLGDRFRPDALKECRAELEKHANLALYTTTIAMDDLDDVRAAMGYEKINLLGGSYGSTAAMSYLRQHPDHVRTVTLKSVAPVDAKLPLPFAAGVEHALERLFSDCAADFACHQAYPDLRNDLAAVVQRFASGPITVKVTNSATQAVEEITLSREVFMESIRVQLYSPSTLQLMPVLIHQMKGGEFSAFASVSVQLMQALQHSIATGMSLSVTCAEDIPFVTDQAASSQMKNTTYGESRVATMRQACAEWPRAVVPASFNDPVKSDRPVLMISGDADPVTPPALAAGAMKYLPNGRQLVIPNGTHLTEDGCIYRLIAQFIDDGSAKKLDPACLNDIKWLPYVIG